MPVSMGGVVKTFLTHEVHFVFVRKEALRELDDHPLRTKLTFTKIR